MHRMIKNKTKGAHREQAKGGAASCVHDRTFAVAPAHAGVLEPAAKRLAADVLADQRGGRREVVKGVACTRDATPRTPKCSKCVCSNT